MAELFVALITPFRADGSLDLAAVPGLLRWLEQEGADGVVPCGTTGEGPSLSLAERKALIETVIQHRGGLRVIAGTGCANLPETIEATNHAINAGAEAAMVVPPFFFKGMQPTGFVNYYRAVCDALPANGKLVLYHIPPQSQVAITPPIIDALLESHPDAILGLKDSGQDDDYTAMLAGHYPQLKIWDGTAPVFANCLADGVAGGIFAIANMYPRQLRAIMDAYVSGGDVAAAQARITALEHATKPTVPALKSLLPQIAGLPTTHVRAPQLDLTPAEAAAVWAKVAPLLG